MNSDIHARIRLGMVGGGQGAFIGGVHRIAARLDDHYTLVAGAFASDAERSRASAAELHVPPERAYADFKEMAAAEAARDDGIEAVAIVTPNHLHYAIARTFLDVGVNVICDKPLTTTIEDARDLVERVHASKLVFGVTHNYSGYPLVRQMRAMVQDGALGTLRLVQVRYVQGWLSSAVETTGVKQAEWRADPARSGPSGSVGDIGTHAYHLAHFVTGMEPSALCADLSTFVPGRRLDDNAHVLMRYDSGARGGLWVSQVATGKENELTLEVYGDAGSLEWRQEQPNDLRYTAQGKPPQIMTRNGVAVGDAAMRATRIPAGHPEGYLESFAQLYTDLAEQIRARCADCASDPAALLVPGVEDGARGVKFIEACLQSSQAGACWIDPRLTL